MGGVNSAREQASSFGGGAGHVCLGVVRIEEEVQLEDTWMKISVVSEKW